MSDKKPWHRPTVMTDEVLRLLAEAFSNAMTDTEACLYADIAPSTLYLYAKDHEGFSEWKEDLKKRPGLKAKLNKVKAISEGDQDASSWWLERKNKEEFANKTILDQNMSGKLDIGGIKIVDA